MKKLFIVFMIIGMLTLLTITSFAEDRYVIGVTMKTLQDEYSRKLGDAIKERAEQYDNIELLLVDAQADLYKQLTQVEDFIVRGVDVIVLNPQDAGGGSLAVKRANEAGIPLIEVNTVTNNTNYVSYVGSSDTAAGKIQGKYVYERLNGKGNVVLLYGNMGQSPQILREKGLIETLLSKPDINLVSAQTANWQRAQAMSITEDWLLKYDDIDAICAQNDDMAMGALRAVEALGRKDIVITGVDAIDDALKAIDEGRLDATVLQDAIAQGYKTVDVALEVAKGNEVEEEYIIPFKLITKDNVEEYIK